MMQYIPQSSGNSSAPSVQSAIPSQAEDKGKHTGFGSPGQLNCLKQFSAEDINRHETEYIST